MLPKFSQVERASTPLDLVVQGAYAGKVYSPWPKDEAFIALHQFQPITRSDAERVKHTGGKRNLPLGGYFYNHDMSPYQYVKYCKAP